MAGANLTGDVTTSAGYVVPADGEEIFSVAAIDLGIKANTPRMLAARGIRTHVLPSHHHHRGDQGARGGRGVPVQRPR